MSVLASLAFVGLLGGPSRARRPFVELQSALSLRQPLERRHTLGQLMEGLLVTGVDRQRRRAIQLWIIERPDLDDDGRKTLWTRRHVGAAVGAELPRHRARQIAALELLGLVLGVVEAA